MKEKYLHFAAGLMVGAALFGGGTALAASGILAEPSAQTFYVDGQKVELEAYAIAGHNYVQLRDVGRAVNFDVTYDGNSNSVWIESMFPYTEETPAATSATPHTDGTAREDFSQQANAAIFTGDLTREMYNAIRQTVVDRDTLLAGDGQGSVWATGTEITERAMQSLAAAIGRYPVYSINTQAGNRFSCDVKYPAAYHSAAEYTQDFIERISDMPQAEQVKEIAWYVADRLTYQSSALSSPATVLVSDTVTPGNCMSYAYNFQFLCNRTDIPCILLQSDDHQWNKVYVDGRWWDVDVSAADAGDDTSHRAKTKILKEQSDMQGKSYIDTQPELTAFSIELLVPGSTK